MSKLTKIEYRKGDLLTSDIHHIAHGCNAQGVMRSGIAKSIRAMYPKAFDDYYDQYVYQGNSLTPGQVITTQLVDRVIFNMITQEYYGRDENVVYVDYEAIRIGILAINLYANCRSVETIGFPMIGAGLANGNWKIIENIIETTAEFNPVVYVL